MTYLSVIGALLCVIGGGLFVGACACEIYGRKIEDDRARRERDWKRGNAWRRACERACAEKAA
jgi:hypothetical protein